MRVPTMKGTYMLPCGCIVNRESEGIERVLKQCDCCAAEWNERQAASAAERGETREKLVSE
jgi:hypothetical protein